MKKHLLPRPVLFPLEKAAPRVWKMHRKANRIQGTNCEPPPMASTLELETN